MFSRIKKKEEEEETSFTSAISCGKIFYKRDKRSIEMRKLFKHDPWSHVCGRFIERARKIYGTSSSRLRKE